MKTQKRRRESFRAKKIPDVFFWYIAAVATLAIVSLTASQQDPILRETIAGTTVSFEMVLVPKGVRADERQAGNGRALLHRPDRGDVGHVRRLCPRPRHARLATGRQ